jgi:redox-sensitive bicupin YhaK (pirin superfamily)
MPSEWLYAEVSLAAGASAPLDPDPEERAIYVVEGEVEIAGETLERPRFWSFIRAAISRCGKAHGASDVSRRRGVGGATLHLVEFRVLAQGMIKQAKEDWKTGRFTPVPGETEFIPLPES